MRLTIFNPLRHVCIIYDTRLVPSLRMFLLRVRTLVSLQTQRSIKTRVYIHNYVTYMVERAVVQLEPGVCFGQMRKKSKSEKSD